MRFVQWSLGRMWCEIPKSLRSCLFAAPVPRTPIWLADGNPLENHPWADNPGAALPEQAYVVLIGAGFTGGALTYHWACRTVAGGDQNMVVLDRGEAASGSPNRKTAPP